MFGLVKALVRGLVTPNYAEDDERELALNNRGDLVVAQGLPAKADIVRLGNSWHCSIATGSAFAPVAAWPTVLANLLLYNNEPRGGKSLLIDQVWAVAITSIAAASSFTLLGQVVPGIITTGTQPVNDTAQLITSLSGRLNYGGNVVRCVANSSYCVANKWDAIGAMAAAPAACIGAGLVADCYGSFIVPPGGLFGVNVVASTAAGTMCQGITWHEAQLPVLYSS